MGWVMVPIQADGWPEWAAPKVKHRMRTLVLLAVILVGGFLRCDAQNTNGAGAAPDPYLPKLRIAGTNSLIGGTTTGYRFSDEQLQRMARTKLETNRLIAYLEQRWPVERLKAHCTKTNTFPDGHQNLVAYKCPVETDLHKQRARGFDRVWVYVSEDDGRGTYQDESAAKWHRWTYSLNVERGSRRWVIIEPLPNDFMDSSRYDPR
jgi:hypothetical protein